jgi:hypothetical protein
MGSETTCSARRGSRSGSGRACLETNEVIFRGDFRVRVPLGELTAVTARKGGTLDLRWRGERLRLELGDAAERWAERIKNPPSRLDKLGIKPASRVALIGAVEATFARELAARAAAVSSGRPRTAVDVIFYAVATPADLARIGALRDRLVPDGALWLIRAKGAAATVREHDARAAARAAGLVDVKVIAFSATHTADKYVVPKARRAAPPVAPRAGGAGRSRAPERK